MMSRDRIVIENIAVWTGLGMTCFIGAALTRHVDWQDAVASTFALLLVLRALRKRGDA